MIKFKVAQKQKAEDLFKLAPSQKLLHVGWKIKPRIHMIIKNLKRSVYIIIDTTLIDVKYESN